MPSDSKSQQVSRTLRSILADINLAVLRLFRIYLWSPDHLVSFPNYSNETNCNWYQPHCLFVFQLPDKIHVFVNPLVFFDFYSMIRSNRKSTRLHILYFLLINTKSGLLIIFFISNPHRILWVSFSRIYSGLKIYRFSACSILTPCTIQSGSTFSTQTCPDLNSFLLQFVFYRLLFD